MKLADDHRRRELAQIHIAKKQLGLDDETYRAMLWTVGRVHSSADLDYAGRRAVLDHLTARGFKSTAPTLERPKDPLWECVNKAAPDRQPMLKKIAMMLKAANRKKEYGDGIAKQMFQIERLEFCGSDQLHRIIGALNYYARRRAERAPAPL